MSLTEDDLKKLSKLAHLNLNEEQLKRFPGELTSILGYMDQLTQIDVSGVEPMSHVHGSTNFFREDVVVEPMTSQEGLKNAPDRSGNFIRVPLIIEQGTEH